MPSDEQLNLESPPEEWLVIRHYINKEVLPEKLTEAQAYRALLKSIQFYDKLARQHNDTTLDLQAAEEAALEAQVSYSQDTPQV